ncbi:MAG: aminoacyl-tRNA hydrolase [bacterium TMED46]|nr:MAG: aminoacyl-tRNA hydrolase [bacterium TMED46]|tara:strand:+ start:2333 stop:2755 length:423 start_codon:yes stop_codon:yes gene_type:complete
MIKINETIFIHDNKMKFKAVKSSGPGGQHINKVSTGIILKYDISNIDYPKWFIANLKTHIKSKKLFKGGIFTIEANSFKSQYRNRKDAVERLRIIFKKSSRKLKKRKKTSPSLQSNENRLKSKKKLSQKKSLRKSPSIDY